MLSKEICKRCRQNCDDKNGVKWIYADECCWEEGHVHCFGFDIAKPKIVINDDPPKHCPYVLEHLMKEQENAK